MARYLVERTFPDGLAIPMTEEGAQVCLTVIGNNAVDGVTWVHSYVTPDRTQMFCIYDAPSPDAIRAAAIAYATAPAATAAGPARWRGR